MKLFAYLYDKTIHWSGHPRAHYYLAGVSFAESSFFPIPPDVMLISMGLAAPRNSWVHALIATLFSVLGGVLGYIIGMYAMEFIHPYLIASSYNASYTKVLSWFEHSGVWITIVAAFTPIPYKLFTITAGALNIAFLPFLVGSAMGRGMRFFLVSSVMYFAGERLQAHLRHYIDVIGWALILLLVSVCIIIKLM